MAFGSLNHTIRRIMFGKSETSAGSGDAIAPATTGDYLTWLFAALFLLAYILRVAFGTWN